jgi:O-antigen/teichoic acid export membrane protein
MTPLRRVLANTGWNLLANVLPLLAAVLAMPWLARQMGTERFGLLTLAWVLIGYFGLFELGLGRALTKFVAERSGTPAASEMPAACSTAVAIATGAGLVGGACVAALAWWPGAWMHGVPQALHGEVVHSLLVIALGIPPTVVAAAFRGVLEGQQRFKLLTAIRVPAGVLLFVAPSVTAAFTPQLHWALASIVLTRWLVLLAHAWPCLTAIHMAQHLVSKAWASTLLRMGGWLTVSSVVAPVIVYADRFVIGGLLSAVALAHYAAPFEMVARLLVLPVALAGALFPALAAAQAAAKSATAPAAPSADQSPPSSRMLRRQASAVTLAAVLPLALLGGAFATPLLGAWMGPDFALQGSTATRILLLGFVFNALAHIPFAALHSYGLARQTALLHLVELPLYLAVLVVLVRAHGIEGAAAAWAGRALFDLAALSWLLRRAERSQARGVGLDLPVGQQARVS